MQNSNPNLKKKQKESKAFQNEKETISTADIFGKKHTFILKWTESKHEKM